MVLLLATSLAMPGAVMGDSAVSLDEKLDIELVDAPAEDVLLSMGEVLGGIEVEMDQEVAERKVTISVHQVTVRTVLNAICESIGCSWRVVENDGADRLVVSDAGAEGGAAASFDERLAERVDLALKGARFEDVLQSMAQILRVDAAIDPASAVYPDLTLELHQTSLREMLDEICEQAGCRWKIEEADGETPKLVIRPG